MSLNVKTIASAQGVGSSAAVRMDTTPHMAKDSGVAVIQPAAGSDRNWALEKSVDDGATWTAVLSGSGAALKIAEVQMAEQMRLTVSGGTAGTVDALVMA